MDPGFPRRPELAALRLADSPAVWTALGFSVTGNLIRLGGVRIELDAPGQGIVAWCLRGVQPVVEIDGLATEVEGARVKADPLAAGPLARASEAHPNQALGLDHVVVVTPDFDRTAAELKSCGMPLRRVRDAPGGFRQGFRRLGATILELVEAPNLDPGPARFWGLVVIVSDLAALGKCLGDYMGEVKGAVQPGRRISTLRPSAGLGEAVAFMSP